MARSICSGCSETFSSESAFNMHRVGSYGDSIYDSNKRVIGYTEHTRKCLSEAGMLQKGMAQNDKGIWITGEFDASVFGKKEREENL